VRQVGYLQELNREGRSTKHQIKQTVCKNTAIFGTSHKLRQMLRP